VIIILSFAHKKKKINLDKGANAVFSPNLLQEWGY
jgi:hypothetical protein